MPVNWTRVAEESIKPFRQAYFELWIDSVKARDERLTNLWEKLLEVSESPFCPNCGLPIDPDESYCILCRDRERERRKRHVRACEKKWKCIVLLHEALAIFCDHPPRSKNDLVARLWKAVEELKNGRQTERSVWAEFKRISELVEDDAGSASRRQLFEECCRYDEDKSERRRRFARLEHLHELVKKVRALGGIIEDELQRC